MEERMRNSANWVLLGAIGLFFLAMAGLGIGGAMYWNKHGPEIMKDYEHRQQEAKEAANRQADANARTDFRERMAKVHDGMTIERVEQAMGRPGHFLEGQGPKETYVWFSDGLPGERDVLWVEFFNGRAAIIRR
jgi:hypothetical protein